MNLIAILSNIRFPDVLDVLFITIVSYQFFVWFWGTKAFKALIGILVLSGIFIIAKSWGLFLTTWVFQILWQVFVILLIILFQREIRQMLERFNPLKSIGIRQRSFADNWLPGFAKWAFSAAEKRVGAVVVFERRDLMFDLITKGISIEANPAPEILNSIFYKESPLHDGAVLISNGKILKTACYLPLSTQEDLPQEWGTRHRAALGLTEQCDAWVLIVSEERGEVSVVSGHNFQKVANEEQLIQIMEDEVLGFSTEKKDFREKIQSWVINRYKTKIVVFLMVFVMWLALAGQQDFEKTIDLPVNFKNLPQGLVIADPVDRELSVSFRGLRKDISLLSQSNVFVSIDVSSTRPGTSFYNISEANLRLPNDRIDVMAISPSRVVLTLLNKSEQNPAEPSRSK